MVNSKCYPLFSFIASLFSRFSYNSPLSQNIFLRNLQAAILLKSNLILICLTNFLYNLFIILQVDEFMNTATSCCIFYGGGCYSVLYYFHDNLYYIILYRDYESTLINIAGLVFSKFFLKKSQIASGAEVIIFSSHNMST